MHFTVLSTSSAAKPSPWNQQNSPQIMICFDDLIVDFCGFFGHNAASKNISIHSSSLGSRKKHKAILKKLLIAKKSKHWRLKMISFKFCDGRNKM